MEVKKHFKILGRKVQDKITGTKGVADSLCFDLYGCIQVSINAGLKKDGDLVQNHWFDISRLKVLGKKPVMKSPNYSFGDIAKGRQGAAHKQSRHI